MLYRKTEHTQQALIAPEKLCEVFRTTITFMGGIIHLFVHMQTGFMNNWCLFELNLVGIPEFGFAIIASLVNMQIEISLTD